MKNIFYLLLLIFVTPVYAQPDTNSIKQNLKKHIAYLASDRLEGRRAGTPGEQKAMQYIAQQFKNYGIAPKGTKGFDQPFEINDGKAMSPGTKLVINGKELKKNEDYFVFPFSSKGVYKGSLKKKYNINGQPTFIGLELAFPEFVKNPHYDIEDAIYNEVNKNYTKDGPKVFFICSISPQSGQLVFNKRDKHKFLPVTVIYLPFKSLSFFPDHFETPFKMSLNADITESKRTGHNVVGFIDNKAANTVVLGAHYDHLGYGEDGNSTWRGEGKQIHNGADDNASGAAALIELAGLLKSSKAKNNNYLFIAFSAEELGLFGSKYFVENPTIRLSSINYMINMDMVGRLNDSANTVTVGGFGTSPQWSGIANTSADFTIKIDSSGSGPSDHTSFYRKDIPVLFYFTGLHQDYHKPSDDYDKINYRGTALIIKNILNLVEKMNNEPKMAFTKTRERQIVNTSFKVTLGIMPDYTYSGNGVKADGVTENRPAALAGLKAGDIITQIGEHNITDMNAYMQVLGKFKKGDVTTIKFKRGTEEKEAQLTF